MIQKIIHQIWYQGCNEIIEPYKSCFIDTIKFLNNTNWTHKVWDKESIEELILNNYPQYFNLYNSCSILVQKLDIARYIILYHYGGCYMDMDMKIIKDFSELLDDNDEIVVSKTQHTFINNGILFSNINNKFWLDFLEDIKPKINKFTFTKLISVKYSTGPIKFTNFVYQKNKEIKIKILDYKYLEPCESKYSQNITDDAYVINYFGNSWVDPYFNILLFVYLNIKIIIVIILIIIMISYTKNKLKIN